MCRQSSHCFTHLLAVLFPIQPTAVNFSGEHNNLLAAAVFQPTLLLYSTPAAAAFQPCCCCIPPDTLLQQPASGTDHRRAPSITFHVVFIILFWLKSEDFDTSALVSLSTTEYNEYLHLKAQKQTSSPIGYMMLRLHLDEEKLLDAVCLEKDVDGFHPINMGNLALRGREPLFIPCTPKACIELLIRSGVKIAGKRAVVIGRSNIVGLPTSLLLQRHHATVTIIHAYTENPEQTTSEADIVVSAAGVPNLVRGNWIKSGATVIDVGTNPVEDPSCEDGYRLVGDVCFEEVIKVASVITPVPGGVGPMTVTMLLLNTLDSAKRMLNYT
ncbi:unnamed protein product [Vicia faba]|uniref:Tetrahydrofolate dehydrogenase/cyclohydrolase NAD(P)-binding domain-containing protein n=1 Tax=Vicia faba TaxID=3906 RepID=A0AAV1A8E7_VICFA|nr:unnamed protein product [Vicia faba]